jgi:hypothetical protein
MQETVAGFEVRCCASQRLHQARAAVHSCVQAAAAARVASKSKRIWYVTQKGDGASVLFHLIADINCVNNSNSGR